MNDDRELLEMAKKAAPKTDIYDDDSFGIRCTVGHWAVFEAYCTQERLSKKDAIMRIFETAINKECFDFIYGKAPTRKPETGK